MSHKATHWAWSVKDISSSEKLILLALADRHNADTGDCFPSLDRIAEDTCSSRNTVRRAAQALEQKGLVTRELITDVRGRTLGYQYHLNMGDSTVIAPRYQDDSKMLPEGYHSDTGGSQITLGEGTTMGRGGYHHGTHGGTTMGPKPVKETGNKTLEDASLSPPVKKKATEGRAGSRLSPDWQPSKEEQEFAVQNGVPWNSEAEKFRDYWSAQPGAKGRKTDWTATWRNWVRRAAETRKKWPSMSGSKEDNAWLFKTAPKLPVPKHPGAKPDDDVIEF